jgi:citrate lyase beta subunit
MRLACVPPTIHHSIESSTTGPDEGFFSRLLGVVDVRAIASASQRIRCALLGSEDLANDLNAERGPDAIELDYARRRFILECRAVRVEPIDAPYTNPLIE